MLSKLSKFFCRKTVSTLSNLEYDIEVYEYGLYLLILKVLFYFPILLISYLMENLLIGIIYLICFTNLRKYAGGFHLKNSFSCYLFSFFISVIALCLSKYQNSYIDLIVIIFNLIILLLSPIETCNNPLNKCEIKKYKKKVLSNLIVINLMIMIAKYLLFNRIYMILCWVIIIVGFLLLLEYKKSYIFK